MVYNVSTTQASSPDLQQGDETQRSAGTAEDPMTKSSTTLVILNPPPSADSIPPPQSSSAPNNLSSDEDDLNFKSALSTTSSTTSSSSSSAATSSSSNHQRPQSPQSRSLSSTSEYAHVTPVLEEEEEEEEVDDEEKHNNNNNNNRVSRSTLRHRPLSSNYDEDDLRVDDLAAGDDKPVQDASRKSSSSLSENNTSSCNSNSNNNGDIVIKREDSSLSSSGDESIVKITSPALASQQALQQQPSSNTMTEEVASLSSMTSNYSQFDITSMSSYNSGSFAHHQPTNVNTANATTTKTASTSSKASTGAGSSFSFSLFKKSTQQPAPASNQTTLGLITSKLLNLKSSSSAASSTASTASSASPPPPSSSQDTSRKSSSHSSCSNASIASNSSGNHNNTPPHNSSFSGALATAADLQVPSSVLIFENRPAHLPAKSQAEALRHRQEYEKMVEVAKKKELREKELRQKKLQQQMKKEDFMANSLKIWSNEILVNWNELKSAKRTRMLWWHGLPPSIRGKIWKLAIGNELNLAKENYVLFERQAREAETNTSGGGESSIELIKLDVSRTFPQLCFFQRDGPYHEALHSVLGAYAFFNKKIGYVQGMSCLAAIFLLNMDAPDAFICLANLLNTKYLLACFRMDQAMMNRYFRVHQILFEHNIPKLYRHFQELKVKPDLYLIEWIFTLFSKSLPLDVVSRVWDVFFRDKEEFLFRTAIGLLEMYKDELLKLDFVHCIQFLTKLPESINATQLFKCIEQVDTTIDGTFASFEQLIAELTHAPPSIPAVAHHNHHHSHSLSLSSSS